MTDQLDRLFDDWVTALDAPAPAMATLHRRVSARRRRRAGLVAVAALAVAGIVGAGLAQRPTREPALLEVSDGQVRLTDHVTLHDLPDWVDHADAVLVDPTPAQRVFGYREQIFALADSTSTRTMRVYVDEGDPFDPTSAAMSRPSTQGRVDGDVAVFDAPAAMVIGSPGDGVVVTVSGDDLADVRRVFDGVDARRDDAPLPGEPVEIVSGVSNGVPWDVRVTHPNIGDLGLAPRDRHCVVLRSYTQGTACIPELVGNFSMDRFATLPAGTDPGLVAIRTVDEATTVIAHRRDGAVEQIDTATLAPAAGRVAVVGWSSDDPVTRIELRDAEGAVIQAIDAGATYGP